LLGAIQACESHDPPPEPQADTSNTQHDINVKSYEMVDPVDPPSQDMVEQMPVQMVEHQAAAQIELVQETVETVEITAEPHPEIASSTPTDDLTESAQPPSPTSRFGNLSNWFVKKNNG
jgi:hypothetical protein